MVQWQCRAGLCRLVFFLLRCAPFRLFLEGGWTGATSEAMVSLHSTQESRVTWCMQVHKVHGTTLVPRRSCMQHLARFLVGVFFSSSLSDIVKRWRFVYIYLTTSTAVKTAEEKRKWLRQGGSPVHRSTRRVSTRSPFYSKSAYLVR